MVANKQPPDSTETWQRLVERIEQAEEGLRERDQALLSQQAKLTTTVERLEHEISRLEGKITDLTPTRDRGALLPRDQDPRRKAPVVRDRSDIVLLVLLGALALMAIGSVPLLDSLAVLYTIAAISVVIPGIFALQLLTQRRRHATPLSPAADVILAAVEEDVDHLLRGRAGR